MIVDEEVIIYLNIIKCKIAEEDSWAENFERQ